MAVPSSFLIAERTPALLVGNVTASHSFSLLRDAWRSRNTHWQNFEQFAPVRRLVVLPVSPPSETKLKVMNWGLDFKILLSTIKCKDVRDAAVDRILKPSLSLIGDCEGGLRPVGVWELHEEL